MSALETRSCSVILAGTPALRTEQVDILLPDVPGWFLDGGRIMRAFTFEDHHQTMAFVNALAWISHRENHHPDVEFGYKMCTVRYSTHDVKGLSENDFICAAKVNALEA